MKYGVIVPADLPLAAGCLSCSEPSVFWPMLIAAKRIKRDWNPLKASKWPLICAART